MAFKCEACEQHQEAKERPYLVVTRVKEVSNRGIPGYNTIEELKTCLLCAVKLTEVAPHVLRERTSTQTAALRKALAEIGFRVPKLDPLVGTPEEAVSRFYLRRAADARI